MPNKMFVIEIVRSIEMVSLDVQITFEKFDTQLIVYHYNQICHQILTNQLTKISTWTEKLIECR